MARHLDMMEAKLNLTEAQVRQLKSQRENTKARMKAIKENEKLSRTERKDQMMAIKKEAKESRKKIFSTEQLKQVEELRSKRKDKKMAG